MAMASSQSAGTAVGGWTSPFAYLHCDVHTDDVRYTAVRIQLMTSVLAFILPETALLQPAVFIRRCTSAHRSLLACGPYGAPQRTETAAPCPMCTLCERTHESCWNLQEMFPGLSSVVELVQAQLGLTKVRQVCHSSYDILSLHLNFAYLLPRPSERHLFCV